MYKECISVAKVMKDYKFNWGIAGGWALDLFTGSESRTHLDIEISIFRKDQKELFDYLHDCKLDIVRNGKLYNWNGEYLELPIHEIHAKQKETGETLEILLNDKEQDLWIYRRNKSIQKDLPIFCYTTDGIPYLCPEIVLLYKSKNTRDKDDVDFFNVLPYLNESRKKWLKRAIVFDQPNHLWLLSL